MPNYLIELYDIVLGNYAEEEAILGAVLKLIDLRDSFRVHLGAINRCNHYSVNLHYN